MVGRTISYCEISETLDEGRMGEVWKSEDTQVRRTAALEFLSPEGVGDDEVKARGN